MLRSIVSSALLTVAMTWLLWRFTATLHLSREIDNIAFVSAPAVAMLVSLYLVLRPGRRNTRSQA